MKQSKIGCHTSISGGLEQAIIRAQTLDCNAIQIFSKSSRTWKSKKLTDKDIEAFITAVEKSDIDFQDIIVHDSYLINLASPDKTKYQKSINAFEDEMKRCDQLGLKYLVMHPGFYQDSSESEGLDRIIEAFNLLYEKEKYQVNILIETMAGQGTCLGYTFEQIEYLINNSKYADKLGVCYDTCHTFAAGYDIRDRKSYEKTFADFENTIGLEKLKVFHFNDSKNPINSKKDRHEQIGKGYIGLEGFKFIMNDSRFQDIPKILETPKGETTNFVSENDKNNLAVLRGLIENT